MSEMHWSRWGDPARAAALPSSARALVDTFVGTREAAVVSADGVKLSDPLAAELNDELAAIVGPEHVLTDRDSRLHHTRGKSTTDLLRIRSGDGSESPDAVVRPVDEEQVTAVLSWCVRRRVALVPYGGGTSVVGGLAAVRDGFAGVISLELARMDRLLDVDPESMIAVLQPGVRGPRAEELLAEHGLTLGHYPQSFEYASIGGFAAARSSGQSSAGYGRFDTLVAGLRVVTPQGPLVLGHAPASAAGPDLRQLVLGSEGAFGIITAVTVRVRRRPAEQRYDAWRFASFADGATAMRALAQGGLLPTVLRLSDETETMVNLARPTAVGESSPGGCLLIAGYDGEPETIAARRTACGPLLTSAGGELQVEDEDWPRGRFDGPYLRDSLLDVGVLVETLETATFWSRVPELYDAVRAALASALGEGALVLCHVSHVYETGASLYFTAVAPEADDPVAQWRAAKAAASEAIVGQGATITHHHGIGRDHRPWMVDEIGPVGVRILRAVKAELDPTGVLNPGVLIP